MLIEHMNQLLETVNIHKSIQITTQNKANKHRRKNQNEKQNKSCANHFTTIVELSCGKLLIHTDYCIL